MYNHLNKELENSISKDCLIENYNSLLNLLHPFTPHFANGVPKSFKEIQK